ncbi:putative Rho GTPase-activating protein 1-5 [Helianthus debilis subsp. tardiflorus]
MTEIQIVQSPLHISIGENDGVYQESNDHYYPSSSFINNTCCSSVEERERRKRREREEGEEEREVSLLAVVVTVVRRSLVGSCNSVKLFQEFGTCDSKKMEIGVPTDVRHVAHVTFDRFNGFLGLPVEFEPELPRRPPSARLHLSFLFFVSLSLYVY